jgi:acyl-CoA thioester hydrolase
MELGQSQAPDGPTRFLVVETGCRYFAEMAFPDTVLVGLRVAHLGRSSVRYELGLFRNDDISAAAAGFLVHVNTERGRPVAIGDGLRTRLSAYDGLPTPA